jgi:tripartite-type tricarboxylate transporter receptor subunit TctC
VKTEARAGSDGAWAIGLAGLLAVGSAYAAEPYPSKPVRIVVGFTPGGFVDFTARLVAHSLTPALGQQVLIDNRPGAGGSIGAEFTARAAPDGYTITVGSVGTHAVNQSLYPKLAYHVLRDFVPVARLANGPSIVAVHPSLPVRSTRELIQLAKARPGQINYASAGAGTSTHLAAVLFEHLGGVRFVHVPFKGGGQSIVALLSGEVPLTFGTAASVSPHTRSGRLRGLAVTGSERSAVLPDLPTVAESGLPGYEMLNWLGFFAPAGTPDAIVEKLAADSLRVVRMPDVAAKFHAQGAEPSPLGRAAFAAFVKAEMEKWAKVVAVTGMTVQ